MSTFTVDLNKATKELSFFSTFFLAIPLFMLFILWIDRGQTILTQMTFWLMLGCMLPMVFAKKIGKVFFIFISFLFVFYLAFLYQLSNKIFFIILLIFSTYILIRLYELCFIIVPYSNLCIVDIQQMAEKLTKNNRFFNKPSIKSSMRDHIISATYFISIFVLLVMTGLPDILIIILFPFSYFLFIKIKPLIIRPFLAYESIENELNKYKSSPVLYLRSFNNDDSKITGDTNALEFDRKIKLEVFLKKYFKKSYPFIAIGNPEDRLPKYGAIRSYYKDDKWQSEVIENMLKAKIILVLLSNTEGVKWEISQVINRKYNYKTLFILPESTKMEDQYQLIN